MLNLLSHKKNTMKYVLLLNRRKLMSLHKSTYNLKNMNKYHDF